MMIFIMPDQKIVDDTHGGMSHKAIVLDANILIRR
jgi:hypothetical protein